MSAPREIAHFIADAAAGNIAPVTQWLNKLDVNSVDSNGHTAILAAAASNRREMVEFLLDRGAHVNEAAVEKRYSPLHAAAEHGNLDICKLLLAKGADATSVGGEDEMSALHLAALNGHNEVCTLLLDAGAPANASAKHGHTALTLAVKHGHVSTVQLLLSRRVDHHSRTWGVLRTALHYAAERGSFDCVAALLAAGADIDPRDHNEVTPLHLAAERGFETSVSELLRAGADPNARTRRKGLGGEMPLHLAAEQGHSAVCRLLIDGGADPTARAGVGRHMTAADYARDAGFAELCEYLREQEDAWRGAAVTAAQMLLARSLEKALATVDADERSAIAPRPYKPLPAASEQSPLIVKRKSEKELKKKDCCAWCSLM